ncbi:ABC transporter permease [Haloferax sp. YSMS24]|uniref:ABC transporter permease n=1 Tax=Haloferax sp. YSMS24 TaxID=3388425 RepID=UPI00398CB72E
MNSSVKFIGKRLARITLTLFVVASVLFVLFRVVPGDPFASVLSKGMTEATLERLRDQYGLSEPMHIQYLLFMKSLFTFQFGQSFTSSQPVWDILQYRLVNTLYLMFTSIVATYCVAYYAGVLMAWNRGKTTDTVGTVVAVLGQGIPPFVTGILFIMLFALTLGWFPVGGMGDVSQSAGILTTITSASFWEHLVLPMVTNSFFFLATPVLLMRSNMVKELRTNYVDYLFAKGIPERRIMFKHAARNSLLPFLTQVALTFGYMIGGQVLVETIFSWPGMGKALVNAVLSNDYPVAQAAFFLIALVVMLANFAVDVMYTALDPRIEDGGA